MGPLVNEDGAHMKATVALAMAATIVLATGAGIATAVGIVTIPDKPIDAVKDAIATSVEPVRDLPQVNVALDLPIVVALKSAPAQLTLDQTLYMYRIGNPTCYQDSPQADPTSFDGGTMFGHKCVVSHPITDNPEVEVMTQASWSYYFDQLPTN